MLRPKSTLLTNMGFHHSGFTGRILAVGFFGAPPNGPPKKWVRGIVCSYGLL